MVAVLKCALALAILQRSDAFTSPALIRSTQKLNAPLVPTKIPELITVNSKGIELASSNDVETEKSTGQIEGGKEMCEPDDEYCAVDEKTGSLIRLTIAEKERIFLDALQSYYVNGRQLLPDDQFDLLKEDLSWNGSKLVQMNRNEAKYLAAVQSYLKGEPVMDDEEFDSLKATLKEEKSQFAVSTDPKCYIDTGICTVTLKEDTFRQNLLYLPVGVILSFLWVGVGYEVLGIFLKINPLIIFGLGLPVIFEYTTKLTEQFVFQNPKIVYGPCPSCEAENRVYFGDILGVKGYQDVAQMKCKSCKTKFDIQRDSMRASTLPPKSK